MVMFGTAFLGSKQNSYKIVRPEIFSKVEKEKPNFVIVQVTKLTLEQKLP